MDFWEWLQGVFRQDRSSRNEDLRLDWRGRGLSENIEDRRRDRTEYGSFMEGKVGVRPADLPSLNPDAQTAQSLPQRRNWNEELSTALVRTPPAPVSGSLRYAIQTVLGRNEVLSPLAPGASFTNPIILDTVNVQAEDWPQVRTGYIDPHDIPESSLVLDSLAPLAGGRIRMGVNSLPSLIGADAITHPTTRRVFLDDIYGGNRFTPMHEAGHVADVRDVNPGLEAIADFFWERQQREHPNVYASTKKPEYKADLFGRAFELIQTSIDAGKSPDAVLEEVLETAKQERLIGLDEVVLEMLRHPLFIDHPLGQALMQREQLMNSTGQDNDQFFLPRIR